MTDCWGILYALDNKEFHAREKGGTDSGRSNGRRAIVSRETNETSIQIALDLGPFFIPPFISTGLNFFDHMLEQIAYHANIGLNIVAVGDLKRDGPSHDRGMSP